MRRTRRELLRDLGAVLAGAILSSAGRAWVRPAAGLAQGAPAGWSRYLQPQLGIVLAHPPGWAVRTLESGQTGASRGPDGLTGPRAYGQLYTVKEGTGSTALLNAVADGLTLLFDDFRVVEKVRLSTTPDLSALRYTFPFVDGLRKGTLTMSVKKGGAVALGFDAPAAEYAASVDTLTAIAGTFRWFESSLHLAEATEPRERAYSVMVPGGWRPDLSVKRPHIDAGFVAKASDPATGATVEVHRPYTPSFIAPNSMLAQAGYREGTQYPLGAKWGMEPLLVYRYMAGKEFIRSYLLPALQGSRPGLAITGLGDRADLAFDPQVALVRKTLGGGGAGGEVEFTWTRADGVRMRGRAVAVTLYGPSPTGQGVGLWGAPQVMLAEAPEPGINTAVVAMLTMNASLKINPRWFVGELKGSRDRWRIIRETEKILFTKYQETVQRRQEASLAAAEQWDAYIRHSFSGSSDYGNYVPYGRDTIRTQDGRVVPVIELGGKTVTEWMNDNPNGYLKKAW